MKKYSKSSLLILVTVNLFIWGYFVYIIIGPETTSNALPLPISKSKEVHISNDSNRYQLSLNYPDPFLNSSKISAKPKASSSLNKVVAKKNTQEMPIMNLPSIKYLGQISSKAGAQSTGLVLVQENFYTVKQNSTVEGLTFVTFKKDCMLVQQSKKKFYVKKAD